MTKHFVNNEGTYLGGFSGSEPKDGIEVPQPPHGLAKWVDGVWVMPPPPTIEEWRATASLSKPDFVNAAADLGMLTDDEAIAAAKGDWPATFDSAISGLSTTDQRKAKVLWAGLTDVQRNADLIALIIASPIPITGTQVDTLFGYGA